MFGRWPGTNTPNWEVHAVHQSCCVLRSIHRESLHFWILVLAQRRRVFRSGTGFDFWFSLPMPLPFVRLVCGFGWVEKVRDYFVKLIAALAARMNALAVSTTYSFSYHRKGQSLFSSGKSG